MNAADGCRVRMCKMSVKSPILIHLFLERLCVGRYAGTRRWPTVRIFPASILGTSFVDSCRRRNGPPHLVAIDREMSLEQRAKRALKRGEIGLLLHVRLGAEHGEAHDDGIGAAVYAELPPDAAVRLCSFAACWGDRALTPPWHRKARQQRHLAAPVDS